MKIAILSFWFSNDNYGQILQCYALQQHYIMQGHTVEHIRYDFKETYPFVLKLKKLLNLRIIVRKISSLSREKKRSSELKYDERKFADFRNKYLKWTRVYSGYKDLKSNPPEADIYVVGSDQVWNFYQGKCSENLDLLHAVFLDFGAESVQRKAYAASWGGMNVDSEYAKEIAPLLKRFNEVSVREKSGIDKCALCGRSDAKWACDPTLLLAPEKYRQIYMDEDVEENMMLKQPYLLLYYLDNGGKFQIDSVYKWAKEKGVEVIYVGGNGIVDKHEKIAATVPQWLYLIDHAKYVITNSFHCSVFAYLFRTKFGVIPMNGINEGMNDRFISLFEYTGILPRFIKEGDFSVLETELE